MLELKQIVLADQITDSLGFHVGNTKWKCIPADSTTLVKEDYG